jgi:hypothetical protein
VNGGHPEACRTYVGNRCAVVVREDDPRSYRRRTTSRSHHGGAVLTFTLRVVFHDLAVTEVAIATMTGDARAGGTGG